MSERDQLSDQSSSAPVGFADRFAKFVYTGVSVLHSTRPETSAGRTGVLPTLISIVIAPVMVAVDRCFPARYFTVNFALVVLAISVLVIVADSLACLRVLRPAIPASTRAFFLDGPLRFLAAVAITLWPAVVYRGTASVQVASEDGTGILILVFSAITLLPLSFRDLTASSLLPMHAMSAPTGATAFLLRIVLGIVACLLARHSVTTTVAAAVLIGGLLIHIARSRPYVLRFTNSCVGAALGGATALAAGLAVPTLEKDTLAALAIQGGLLLGGALIGALLIRGYTIHDVNLGKQCMKPYLEGAVEPTVEEPFEEPSLQLTESLDMADPHTISARIMGDQFKGARSLRRRPVAVLNTYAAHCIEQGDLGLAESALRTASICQGRQGGVNALTSRPSSAFGARLLLTSLLLQLDDSVTRGIVELKRLERTKEPPFGVYLSTLILGAYADKKRRAQSIGTAEGAGVDLQAVVSHLDIAKRYHRQALATQIRVWSHLARRKLKYQQAHDAAADASAVLVKAETAYRHIIDRLNYRRPDVLNMYALFLSDIRHDTGSAARLRDEAERSAEVDVTSGAIAHSVGGGSSIISAGSSGSQESQGSAFASEALSDIRSGHRSIRLATFRFLSLLIFVSAAALSLLLVLTSLNTVPLAELTADIASTLKGRIHFAARLPGIGVDLSLESYDLLQDHTDSGLTALADYSPLNGFAPRVNRTADLREELVLMSAISTAIYHGSDELGILDSDTVGLGAYYLRTTPRSIPFQSVSPTFLPSSATLHLQLFKDWCNSLVSAQRITLTLFEELALGGGVLAGTTSGIDEIYTTAFGNNQRMAYATAVSEETHTTYIPNWIMGSAGIIDTGLGSRVTTMTADMLVYSVAVVTTAILCLAFAYSTGFRTFQSTVVSRGWSALSLVAYADRISVLNVKRASMSRFVTFERGLSESAETAQAAATSSSSSLASPFVASEPLEEEAESTDYTEDHDDSLLQSIGSIRDDQSMLRAASIEPYRSPGLRFAEEAQSVTYTESLHSGGDTQSESASSMASSSVSSESAVVSYTKGRNVITGTHARLRMERKIAAIRVLALIGMFLSVGIGVALLGTLVVDVDGALTSLSAVPSRFEFGWLAIQTIAHPLSHDLFSPLLLYPNNTEAVIKQSYEFSHVAYSNAATYTQFRLEYGQHVGDAVGAIFNRTMEMNRVLAPWRSLVTQAHVARGETMAIGYLDFGADAYDITAQSWSEEAQTASDSHPKWRTLDGSPIWYSSKTADAALTNVTVIDHLAGLVLGDTYTVEHRDAIVTEYAHLISEFSTVFHSRLDELHSTAITTQDGVTFSMAISLGSMVLWYLCILVALSLTKRRLGVSQGLGLTLYTIILPAFVLGFLIVGIVYSKFTDDVIDEFVEVERTAFNGHLAAASLASTAFRVIFAASSMLQQATVNASTAFAGSVVNDLGIFVPLLETLDDDVEGSLASILSQTCVALGGLKLAGSLGAVDNPLTLAVADSTVFADITSALESATGLNCLTLATTAAGGAATPAAAARAVLDDIRATGCPGGLVETTLAEAGAVADSYRAVHTSSITSRGNTLLLATVGLLAIVVVLVLPTNILIKWTETSNTWMRNVKANRVELATKTFVSGLTAALVITAIVVIFSLSWSLGFRSTVEYMAKVGPYPIMINAITVNAMQASMEGRHWSPAHRDRGMWLMNLAEKTSVEFHREPFRRIPSVKKILLETAEAGRCLRVNAEECALVNQFYEGKNLTDSTALLIKDTVYGSVDALITVFSDLGVRRASLLGSPTAEFPELQNDSDLQVLIATGQFGAKVTEDIVRAVADEVIEDASSAPTVRAIIVGSSIVVILVALCVLWFVLDCLRTEAKALFDTMLAVPSAAIMRCPQVSEFLTVQLRI